MVGCWKKPEEEDSRPHRHLSFDRSGFSNCGWRAREKGGRFRGFDSGSIERLRTRRMKKMGKEEVGGRRGKASRSGRGEEEEGKGEGKGRLTGECAQLRFLTGKCWDFVSLGAAYHQRMGGEIISFPPHLSLSKMCFFPHPLPTPPIVVF